MLPIYKIPLLQFYHFVHILFTLYGFLTKNVKEENILCLVISTRSEVRGLELKLYKYYSFLSPVFAQPALTSVEIDYQTLSRFVSTNFASSTLLHIEGGWAICFTICILKCI